jgi:hypothetical protein
MQAEKTGENCHAAPIFLILDDCLDDCSHHLSFFDQSIGTG